MQQVDSLLRSERLSLGVLRTLVVDEVDACVADDDSRAQLHQLLTAKQLALAARTRSAAAPPRQTLFVGASLPQRQHFRRMCVQRRWCAAEPVLLHAEPTETLPTGIAHAVAACAPPKRLAALRVLLRAEMRREPRTLDRAIVFAPKSLPLERIASALAGVVDAEPPPILSEDVDIDARAAALRAIRDGSTRLMLSTSLGARGIDIEGCSHVYILGAPPSAEDYLHAAGRCGRMGRPGFVTTLCPPDQMFVMRRVGNALGIDFDDATPAGAPDRPAGGG